MNNGLFMDYNCSFQLKGWMLWFEISGIKLKERKYKQKDIVE